jgi:hypothetical protein
MKYLHCVLFVMLLSSYVFANDNNNLDVDFNFGETCNNNIPCVDDSEPKSEYSTEEEKKEELKPKTKTIEKKSEDIKK